MEARDRTLRDERDRDDAPPPDRLPPGEQPPDRDAMPSRQDAAAQTHDPDADADADRDPGDHPGGLTEPRTGREPLGEPPGPVRDPAMDREEGHGIPTSEAAPTTADRDEATPDHDRSTDHWDVTDRDAGSSPGADQERDRDHDRDQDRNQDHDQVRDQDRDWDRDQDRDRDRDQSRDRDWDRDRAARDPAEAGHAQPTEVLPAASLTPESARPAVAGEPDGKTTTDTRTADTRTDGAPGAPSAEAVGPLDEPLLDPDTTRAFAAKWEDVQAAFLDSPRESVRDADRLVAELVEQLSARFAERRDHLESTWTSGGEVTTEDLRVTLQRYRGFFHRLLAS